MWLFRVITFLSQNKFHMLELASNCSKSNLTGFLPSPFSSMAFSHCVFVVALTDFSIFWFSKRLGVGSTKGRITFRFDLGGLIVIHRYLLVYPLSLQHVIIEISNIQKRWSNCVVNTDIPTLLTIANILLCILYYVSSHLLSIYPSINSSYSFMYSQ